VGLQRLVLWRLSQLQPALPLAVLPLAAWLLAALRLSALRLPALLLLPWLAFERLP
jgi:hypothetical protein